MADVFVSWSGDRSKQVASALKMWLPDVFQALDVWMSDQDIQAGSRWGAELSTQLESTRLGVVCLTPENRASAWIIFESGALSKSISEARVVPYRFGLGKADVGPPLSQFQGVDSDQEGTLRLVKSLNTALGDPLPSDRLERQFSRCWPDLSAVLARVPADDVEAKRSDRDVLEEILATVRQPSVHELTAKLGEILAQQNVEKIEVAPKSVAGKDTGALSLVVVVRRKLPLGEVAPQQVIPSELFGMPTDVVATQDRAQD